MMAALENQAVQVRVALVAALQKTAAARPLNQNNI